MNRLHLKSTNQSSRGETAWTFREKIVIMAWEVLWNVFLRWTPKKFNRIRLFALRMFGAKIQGRPFVFSSSRIYAPFNLELHDHACVGPDVHIYNLGNVVLHENSTISQGTMLCGGTHDLSSPALPLMVGDIEIGEEVFIGARAMILGGVKIGRGGVVGAAGIVAKDVDEWTIVAGNPAREVGKRRRRDE